jgi:uncharacterized coiled-coil protein SlyX
MPSTIMDTEFEPYKRAVEQRITELERKIAAQNREIERIKQLLAGNGMVLISS